MKDLVPLCGGWSPRVLPAALTHRPTTPPTRDSANAQPGLFPITASVRG